ncbi:hypothetical protein L2725_07155 [Shewanella corallii]|uniref:Uncharacterized protein n=1 Tax=Shewanella corallii TaxID=560080 RepID=A0ABT0N5X8_9GAMM|nr:hypothetical protein [Shewanella corallii]
MSSIEIKQEEALSIKFTHLLEVNANCRVDLYFSLPNEMGINPKSFDEQEYFHSGILGRRSYYSEGLHIPLVQSRFVSLSKRTIEEFRLYLNLFAYQFAIAVENDAKQLKHLNEAELFYPSVVDLARQVESTLKKFRRSEPSEEKRKSYFENADNYLSWFCEQQLLKLMSERPRSSGYTELRDEIFVVCRNESAYRLERNYNSSGTVQDANRISNKMLLLRRLIQRGVVLKEESKTLGTWLKKATTGFATGIIMLVVSALILKAQGVLSGLTIAMLFTLAVIYAFREVFKDDIRNAMWRRIQRGRPRWSRILRDTTSGMAVARQLVWLDFMTPQDLPAEVDEILKRRHRQNKVDAEILHYGVNTRVQKDSFLSGYNMLQEQVSFSLVPFARYLERGKAKVYQERDSKVSYDSAERRYQVNVVVSLKEGKSAPRFARYKITMNRSNIVEITQSEVPDGVASIESKHTGREMESRISGGSASSVRDTLKESG